MFQNPFSFEGRIRRLEFGLSVIIHIVVYVIAVLLVSAAGSAGAILMILLYIPMTWFALAQNAKRCHDVGRSGWWQLIPFYGFVLLFQDGDPGSNEYGDNPKEPEQEDVLNTETLDGHLKDNNFNL